jgi:glutamyl-tRNA synthetase/glutamyl-Q tRNA(Asp) synthetase
VELNVLRERLKDASSPESVAVAALRADAGGLVTRFAPSPTGHLHDGHLLHITWVWEVAGTVGAEIVVRMEDHDRGRCRPEYETSILHDLAALRRTTAHPSLASLRMHPSPWRQSDHPERYQAAFDQLNAAGLLYGCTCTRGDLPPPGDDGERRYPGTCRGQPIEGPGPRQVRVMLPDEPTEVRDLVHGTIAQHPAREHGDPVIRNAAGEWSYLLCVVVDDMHDAVNLIIRGDDLRTSTGRQYLLARLLGRTTPFVTLHHPLVMGPDGRKLSKRGGIARGLDLPRPRA